MGRVPGRQETLERRAQARIVDLLLVGAIVATGAGILAVGGWTLPAVAWLPLVVAPLAVFPLAVVEALTGRSPGCYVEDLRTVTLSSRPFPPATRLVLQALPIGLALTASLPEPLRAAAGGMILLDVLVGVFDHRGRTLLDRLFGVRLIADGTPIYVGPTALWTHQVPSPTRPRDVRGHQQG